MIQMKEEYHAKFTTILQIVYQQERLAYFSNCIAIIFNKQGEEGQLVLHHVDANGSRVDMVDNAPKVHYNKVSNA